MNIVSQHGEVIILRPTLFYDDRGWFTETFKQSEFSQLTGISTPFVQDNHSHSDKGVIRGLHYQPEMGKLMRVTRGGALLVAVNLLTGEVVERDCSEYEPEMIWAPAHYARGFQALTDQTEVQYKCTAEYDPKAEGAVHYDSVGVKWFGLRRIVSLKDSTASAWQVGGNPFKI